jgi:hypothetical protein
MKTNQVPAENRNILLTFSNLVHKSLSFPFGVDPYHIRTLDPSEISRWLIISLITALSLWVLYGDMIITGANCIGVSLNVLMQSYELTNVSN